VIKTTNQIRSRKFRSCQSGQAMVEFMLSTIFLVFLVVAILEVAAFIYTYSVLANAAKEGVRYAIVHGANSANASGLSGTSGASHCTTASTNAVVSQVRSFAAFSLHKTSTVTVNVCYPANNDKLSSLVQVTVSYPYQPFFFKWPSVAVFANAAGRIVF
jgi:Flp pilus assembly protein TadG